MAIKVDLLPTERRKLGFDPLIAMLVVLIAFSVVIFYYFGVNLEKDIADRRSSISQIEGEVQSLQQQLPIIEKLRKENQELEIQISTVKTLRYDPIRYCNILDEIAHLLPDNMWLNSIVIEPSQAKVTMAGNAAALPGIRPLESLAGFMKCVQKSPYFSGASLSGTTRGTVTVEGRSYMAYSFSIELTYDPKAAENTRDGGVEAERGNPLVVQREGGEAR